MWGELTLEVHLHNVSAWRKAYAFLFCFLLRVHVDSFCCRAEGLWKSIEEKLTTAALEVCDFGCLTPLVFVCWNTLPGTVPRSHPTVAR